MATTAFCFLVVSATCIFDPLMTQRSQVRVSLRVPSRISSRCPILLRVRSPTSSTECVIMRMMIARAHVKMCFGRSRAASAFYGVSCTSFVEGSAKNIRLHGFSKTVALLKGENIAKCYVGAHSARFIVSSTSPDRTKLITISCVCCI